VIIIATHKTSYGTDGDDVADSLTYIKGKPGAFLLIGAQSEFRSM